MAAPTLDRETVLRTIQTWPLTEQMALVQTILHRATARLAEAPASAQLPQRPSWREMAGLAAVPGQEPPSDEQVAQWLDEHRMEKYGG